MAGKTSYTHKGISNSNIVGTLVSVFAAILLLSPLATGYLWAAEERAFYFAKESQGVSPKTDSAPVRYRVFSLRHISAQKGKEYLAEVKIGTVSQLPGANMLLVTAQPRELIKANAILKLVDAKDEFVIKTISPASLAQEYPSNERIAAEVGNILIGTFSNPPRRGKVPGAIIDIHDGAVIAVAPVNRLEKIISAIGRAPTLQEDGETGTQQFQETPTEVVELVEPNQPQLLVPPEQPPVKGSDSNEVVSELKAEQITVAELEEAERITASGEFAVQADANESEPNELFGRLLRSLAEAEKRAAEQSKQVSEANEPKTITTVPEPNEPNAVTTLPKAKVPSEPSAGVEPAPERAKQLTDVELADILRRLQALEAGVKAEPEPKAEPIEKAVPRIEQPNEIETEEVVPRIEQPNEIEAEEVVPRIEQPNEIETEEVVPRIEQPNEIEVEEVVPRIEQPNEVEVRALIPKVEQPNEVEVKKVAAKVEQPKEVNEISDVNKIAQPVPKVGLYEPEPLANGEDIIQLDLPEKLSMIEFLDFMGENLQLDYLYNPAEVKGDVTLRLRGQLRGPIKVKNLYPLLQSVLQFNDFVMVRDRNLVTIRKKASADILKPPLVRPGGDEIETGDVVIQRVFELKHIDTGSGQNLLKGLQLGIKITPIQQTGTLIVTEYAHRMARIQELLEMIDKPGEPKQFKLRELKFTMAESLTPKIKTLAEQLGTISVTVAAPAAAPQKAPPRGRKAPPPRRGAPAPPKPTAKPTVYLEADKRTNRILMIGLKEQLAVVDELITVLDVEQKDLRSMRLYQIENVDAQEVRAKLSELGIIGGAGAAGRAAARSGRLTGAAAKAGAKPPPASARARARTGEEAAPLVEEPQVVIIETINSLLVNATAEQHVQIATIIGYVDNEPEATDIPYVIYPLENQDPEELSGVLNQLVQETTTKQDKAGKVEKTTRQRTEEEIIIIPDPKTYSLIVYATKRNQQWIKALIDQLDVYRPQVLLDVMLVEITKNDEFNYDLDILSAFPDLTRTTGYLADAILPPNVTGGGRDRYIELWRSEVGGGTGFYADKHINILLDAVQKKSYGRILARPKLLVNDNEEGIIKAEETTYIVRTESSIVPGTTTGTSTTVEKTIFDDYSAGITLTITPHISGGANLRLDISLVRSDFRITQETIDLGKPPDTVTSDVSTKVTVPDKHTIILGGLERLSQSKGGSKVPILGDIPLIGGLFRSTANTDSQSRLYIFVKAHILRPGEELTGASDIELVSAKTRAAFEKYEEEMQKYEDWPGIKPKPMDPVRVLETD